MKLHARVLAALGGDFGGTRACLGFLEEPGFDARLPGLCKRSADLEGTAGIDGLLQLAGRRLPSTLLLLQLGQQGPCGSHIELPHSARLDGQLELLQILVGHGSLQLLYGRPVLPARGLDLLQQGNGLLHKWVSTRFVESGIPRLVQRSPKALGNLCSQGHVQRHLCIVAPLLQLPPFVQSLLGSLLGSLVALQTVGILGEGKRIPQMPAEAGGPRLLHRVPQGRERGFAEARTLFQRPRQRTPRLFDAPRVDTRLRGRPQRRLERRLVALGRGVAQGILRVAETPAVLGLQLLLQTLSGHSPQPFLGVGVGLTNIRSAGQRLAGLLALLLLLQLLQNVLADLGFRLPGRHCARHGLDVDVGVARRRRQALLLVAALDVLPIAVGPFDGAGSASPASRPAGCGRASWLPSNIVSGVEAACARRPAARGPTAGGATALRPGRSGGGLC
mmetsp:Transcript_66971/g.217977  ORF Transcript_66971/g.217977 Transcript_66971/m.217977 type:complete len:447 (-) Transcript_66971:1021-2361(-)